ncbi:MAG: ABC transporter permease [Planctomycetes bacterium]|nr:ABC transporter permease [Planctomycetota bacterium]
MTEATHNAGRAPDRATSAPRAEVAELMSGGPWPVSAARTAGPAAAAVVTFGASLSRATAAAALGEACAALDSGRRPVVLDLGAVHEFDSAGIAVISEVLRRGRAAGIELELRGTSAPLRECLALLSGARAAPAARPGRRGPVAAVGAAVLPGLQGVRAAASLLRRSLRALLIDPLRGRRPRLDRCLVELECAANGAVPITALIALLLGLVLAMQAFVQLRNWSAELLVANMVGVAVVTEIGPLMTAIVLAARSASANAAQLGAMVVGEELDALRQMGVDPHRFLIVPKVLALTVAAVVLCVLFDVVATCGAACFAWAAADIAPTVFRAQLEIAVSGTDVVTGLAKCGIFGGCIGVIGCSEGLRVEGGSAGVGVVTTRAVVLAVLAVICVDAAFVFVQRLLLG